MTPDAPPGAVAHAGCMPMRKRYLSLILATMAFGFLLAAPGATPGAPSPPHNGKIAFVRNGNIWVMGADGSHQTQVTNTPFNNLSPSWSPGGGWIAFSSSRDGNDGEIYLMRADGSDQHAITDNQVDDLGPSWSPDGKRIAFVRDNEDGLEEDIWVMNADGSGAKRLTRGPGMDNEPAWSTRGDVIAFNHHSGRIYLIRTDGKRGRRLPGSLSGDYGASWSRDGTRLAFTRHGDIFTMGVNGHGLRRLTAGGYYDFFPDWSPTASRSCSSANEDTRIRSTS